MGSIIVHWVNDQWPIPNDLIDHKDPVLGLNLTLMLFTREEVMQTVQQQVALANMQELLVKVGQVHSFCFFRLQEDGNHYPHYLYTPHKKGDRQMLQEVHHLPWIQHGKQ